MKQLTEKERLLIIEFLTRRKSIYSLLGWVFGLSLLSSLVVITLPKELTPNYAQMIQDYGMFITYVIAFFIGSYFSSISLIVIGVKLFALWLCFHFEAKLKAAGKSGLTVKNLIIGWGNSVNNNITSKDEKH